jgi:hypothetical protein
MVPSQCERPAESGSRNKSMRQLDSRLGREMQSRPASWMRLGLLRSGGEIVAAAAGVRSSLLMRRWSVAETRQP